MTTAKMVQELRKMHSQIIHGTKIFGEIADRLENQDALCADLQKRWDDEAIKGGYSQIVASETYKSQERLRKLSELLWETRWVSDDADYQEVVAIAAEIRSGSYEGLDKKQLVSCGCHLRSQHHEPQCPNKGAV